MSRTAGDGKVVTDYLEALEVLAEKYPKAGDGFVNDIHIKDAQRDLSHLLSTAQRIKFLVRHDELRDAAQRQAAIFKMGDDPRVVHFLEHLARDKRHAKDSHRGANRPGSEPHSSAQLAVSGS